MPKIYDNIENYLTHGLNETLEVSKRADFCVGYFNLRGWKQVANKIETLEGDEVIEKDGTHHRICRLLVGMQKMPLDSVRDIYYKVEEDTIDNAGVKKFKERLAQEFKTQLTIGTPTEADEAALRKLSRQLKERKVVVKLFLRHKLHAKLYLTYSNDKRVPIYGYVGSSNLTLSGLSYQGELNVDVADDDAAKKLAKWFDERWNDTKCYDITEELIEIIDNSWAADRLNLPYHIYLKVAYHLSREARAGISEFKLSKVFANQLFDFQQKAVQVAAHHLHKRGGVMIGDVVGLGKTITATALAKMFQDDFSLETLIICPPNLKEMWEGYCIQYHLTAKILSVGEVIGELKKLRRFRLVIIDESQNLRNHEGKRYRAIKEYITENESKVILLTATPYNKKYQDLSNQLRLFISDDLDLGISPEHYINSIGGQVQFTARHTETFIRSIKAFEWSQYPDDWRELMRLYMVRRTRTFIKENYAETDTSNGKKYLTFPDGTRSYFPDRIPLAVQYAFNEKDKNDQYAKLYSNRVVDIINGLKLSRYGLGNFIDKNSILRATTDEERIIQLLSRAGVRLMGFCRTNLFKRLESSGYSFLLSLSRHVLRNYVFIYAIQNNLPLPIGKNLTVNLDEFLDDDDLDAEGENELKLVLDPNKYLERAADVYAYFKSDAMVEKFDWIRTGFFFPLLVTDMIEDANEIIQILQIGKDWNEAEDRQLNALYDLLTNKHASEKVLVFTQFADTANYLTNNLRKRGLADVEVVTGGSKNPTTLAHRFSPVSNGKRHEIDASNEIRVLIATDVLSEGQNLQDSHIVLNYDLSWAIIRLIQRAGRVDRIGQKAEKILCYSFLPEAGIESIINLRGRLRTRIRQNADVVGSDETFFDDDPINIQDLYSGQVGALDDEDTDTEVDLASFAYQIWKNATDADPSLLKTIPDLANVIYATKENTSTPDKEGVVVYTRTSEDNDVLAWLDAKGKVITQSQLQILKGIECNADTPPQFKLDAHHELVKKAMEHIREDEQQKGTSLGKKTGVKYRAYTRLKQYCENTRNGLFVTDELKKAVDDILNFPLKEFGRETLNRQLKAGINDDDLATLAVSLREDDKLVIHDDDERIAHDPYIICSLGIKNLSA